MYIWKDGGLGLLGEVKVSLRPLLHDAMTAVEGSPVLHYYTILVYTYIYIYIYEYFSLSLYTYIYIYVYMYTRIYVYMYVNTIL